MLRKLEDHRPGYPSLAAFLNLDPNFTIMRRFDNLHMRVLLEHQDRLAELEEKLQQCDEQEDIRLNLCSRRQDTNQTRRILLQTVEAELEKYNQSVLRFRGMMSLSVTSKRHQHSVRNWFMGNKPLVRSESRVWLSLGDADADFVSLAPEDPDRGGMEALFDVIVQIFPFLARIITSSKTQTADPNIFIFPRAIIRTVLKFMLAFIIPIGLLLPGLLLYRSTERWIRAVISALFTFGASFVICFTMKTTKYSLFLAVVAYGAVLSEFLAGS
ncbi:hypothetical protein K469DRAFT_175293 [Zopfia rhizophila CBS 207.26]|uniref:DUF6594 domain-containing protein n=1 Tax=Zopfia rhizophila CBS 207.26 TaxID=1314779 RepID=A0A6A6DZ94_9PEZI|nr:hypothetical protein K469DRAFT_175293 [Zopfia rhizophila CBS 207.26]